MCIIIWKLLCELLLIVLRSFYYISLTIITRQPSVLFIMVTITLHNSINFGVLTTYINNIIIRPHGDNIYHCVNSRTVNNNRLILVCYGLCYSVSNILLYYTIDATRVAPILQSNLLTLGIFFTMIFRYYWYNYKLIVSYLIFGLVILFISIGLGIFPIVYDLDKLIWVGGFLISVIFASVAEFILDIYLKQTENCLTHLSKAYFCANVIQLVLIGCFCWIDMYVGHGANVIEIFINNFNLVINEPLNYLVIILIAYSYLMYVFIDFFIRNTNTTHDKITNSLSIQLIGIFYFVFDHVFEKAIDPTNLVTIICLIINFY